MGYLYNVSRETKQEHQFIPTTDELSEFYDAYDAHLIEMVTAVNRHGNAH